MRTHLLRPIYAPSAEVEPDTGMACNDECFNPDGDAATLSNPGHTQLVLLKRHADDYVLGGYAGI